MDERIKIKAPLSAVDAHAAQSAIVRLEELKLADELEEASAYLTTQSEVYKVHTRDAEAMKDLSGLARSAAKHVLDQLQDR